jgi:hypothetical protein
MEYANVKSKKTHEEYLRVVPEKGLTNNSCRQLLIEINGECLMHGYEKIMLDLSKLERTLSVDAIYQATTRPETIKFLPFRLAWVSDDESWDKDWKSLELIMKKRSLPWRRFTNTELAEQWLSLDRSEINKDELKSRG